jgi:CRP/FNR family transcriptional regulator, cyclic AMP receptor protein
MNNENIEKLRKIIIFSDFTNDDVRLNKFSKILKKEKYPANEYIIKEGEIGDKLFILNYGKVKILRNTLDNEEYTVAVLESDDNIFFGELALIDSEKRSASVLADSECEVLSIDRASFIKLCEEDPLLGYKTLLQIAKRISSSLRKMNNDVITLYEALVEEVEGDIS